MGIARNSEVRNLLQDPQLVSEIARAVMEDPDTVEFLADDVAVRLAEELEGDPELRQKIVEVAVTSPEFKHKVVKRLVDSVG